MGPTRIPAESAELLAFDGVSFAVDADREILHGVSLSVAPAAVTVLAGPSGAGKSTLLRLGNRLDIPSAGSVRFRGQDSAAIDPRELRRRVGMVFQRPVPFAGAVRENLKVGAPLAGMMIGNSMTACVLVGRRIVDELSEKRDEVEARLALGQSWQDASRPYVRSALRTALVPQIESTKAVGLVFLPGAMTGLVLAGVDAVDAVTVQLAIMYLILGSVATSVTVIGLGLTRRVFTSDHRLRSIERATH